MWRQRELPRGQRPHERAARPNVATASVLGVASRLPLRVPVSPGDAKGVLDKHLQRVARSHRHLSRHKVSYFVIFVADTARIGSCRPVRRESKIPRRNTFLGLAIKRETSGVLLCGGQSFAADRGPGSDSVNEFVVVLSS